MFETTLPTQHAMRQVAKSTPAAPKGEKMSTTTFACERTGRSRWRISTRLRGGGEGEHSSTDIVAAETMTNNSNNNNNDDDDDDNNDDDDDDNDDDDDDNDDVDNDEVLPLSIATLLPYLLAIFSSDRS